MSLLLEGGREGREGCRRLWRRRRRRRRRKEEEEESLFIASAVN